MTAQKYVSALINHENYHQDRGTGEGSKKDFNVMISFLILFCSFINLLRNFRPKNKLRILQKTQWLPPMVPLKQIAKPPNPWMIAQRQWKIFLKALHNPVTQSFNFPLRYKG